MGFFSMNEHSNLSNNFDFPVVEGYDGTVGAGLAIVEGYQNDLALFTAAVQYDLAEMAAVSEGADVEALQEASLSGAWEAIKSFFKKLGAKIVALFRAFMAKLESYFNTDTKAYVKRYKKGIQGKDFKDFKCKCSLEKEGWENKVVYPVYIFTTDLSGDALKAIDKKAEDSDREEMLEYFYSGNGNGKNGNASNAKEFDEWLHEEAFEDEEDQELGLAEIMKATNDLEGGTKRINKLKTAQDKFKSEVAKALRVIDKAEKEINSKYKDAKDGTASSDYHSMQVIRGKTTDDGRVKAQSYGKTGRGGSRDFDLADAQRAISVARSMASAYQEVSLHMCQAIMKETKFAVAQQKKIFSKAVAYRTIKEGSLLTAIEECAFDETMEFFDTPYVA